MGTGISSILITSITSTSSPLSTGLSAGAGGGLAGGGGGGGGASSGNGGLDGNAAPSVEVNKRFLCICTLHQRRETLAKNMRMEQ